MKNESKRSIFSQPVETAKLIFPTDLITDIVLGYGCILLAGSFVKAVWRNLQRHQKQQSSTPQDSSRQSGSPE